MSGRYGNHTNLYSVVHKDKPKKEDGSEVKHHFLNVLLKRDGASDPSEIPRMLYIYRPWSQVDLQNRFTSELIRKGIPDSIMMHFCGRMCLHKKRRLIL